ncbi:hypothetical protein YC2023_004808 [Brassica napus]
MMLLPNSPMASGTDPGKKKDKGERNGRLNSNNSMLQTIKLDHQPNLIPPFVPPKSIFFSSGDSSLDHSKSCQRPSSSNWKRRMIQLLILILLRPFTLSSTLGTCLTSYNATLAQIIQDFANPESLSRFLTTETYDKVVDSLM